LSPAYDLVSAEIWSGSLLVHVHAESGAVIGVHRTISHFRTAKYRGSVLTVEMIA
jgi:hypothetical protein